MSQSDPFQRFRELYDDAVARDLPEPNAMTLSTSTPDGIPSSRVVLLKDFDDNGFVFYTNLESRKGSELLANPHAALCFYWPGMLKQVRIEGTAALVSESEADEYFSTRPRGSQIGAWASSQSRPLATRRELLERVAEFERRYDGTTVPRPPHWSGFRVAPVWMEIWTGEEFRLHDREVFERAADGTWRTYRVYP